MAQVIGCIISIVIAGWFFVSARSIGRSEIGWAVIGFSAILVPSFAWSICVSLVYLSATDNLVF